MSDSPKPIIKVVSTHPPSQGAFVLMYEEDFDPAVHTLYVEEAVVVRREPSAESVAVADVDTKVARRSRR